MSGGRIGERRRNSAKLLRLSCKGMMFKEVGANMPRVSQLGSNGLGIQRLRVSQRGRSFLPAQMYRDARSSRATARVVEELESRVLLSAPIIAFSAQATFAVGAGPGAVSSADLNRDGIPDLVVANQAAGSVSVLVGNGDGTFEPQKTFAVGGVPTAMAIADFNRDGKVDLAIVNSSTNSVDVLLGDGSGGFAATVAIATGHAPSSLALADFNGDGKTDLAVTNTADNTVGVLLGNGDGTFLPQQTILVGTAPMGIAAADFNADGKPDIAVADSGSTTFGILLGVGNGGFGPQVTYFASPAPASIQVFDATGDGIPDLFFGSVSAANLEEFKGNADGSFVPWQSIVMPAQNSFVVSDLNADLTPDYAATVRGANVLKINPARNNLSLATGNDPYGILVADVNRDGRKDIIVTNRGDNTIGVYLGDVPPTVIYLFRTDPPPSQIDVSSVTYTATFNEPVTGVDVSDFSVDIETQSGGDLTASTVAVTRVSPSVYHVTVGGLSGVGFMSLSLRDDGTIKDAAGNPLQPGGVPAFVEKVSNPRVVNFREGAVADVNGDGNADLLSPQGSHLGVWFGNGDGTFGPLHTFGTNVADLSISVADVNGDGKPDAVVTSADGVAVLFGDGAGNFTTLIDHPTPNPVYSITTADVNGDGKLDAVVTYGTTAVGVLLGNGDGSFQNMRTFSAGAQTTQVVAADTNRDGMLDLVALSSETDGNVSELLGNGDGTFQPQVTFGAGHLPSKIAVGDINRDGSPDLVVSGRSDTSVILFGNGDGTYQAPRTFQGGGNAIAIADMNGDGIPDVTLSTFSGPLILFGRGDGTFPLSAFGYSNFSGMLSGMIVADINNDGRPDVIATPQSSGSFDASLARADGGVTTPAYQIFNPPVNDTIDGTANSDTITLVRESVAPYIDWTLGSTSGKVAIDDPAGLTINGNGSNDVITLSYTNGIPLPNLLHLNGTFTLTAINGSILSGTAPLAGTTIDIGASTLFVFYASASDPISAVRAALAGGYNGGSWTGSGAGTTTGAIVSSAAAQNPGLYSVGYADSADGTGVNATANSIEVKFTVAGDTNLDGVVNSTDAITMARNYLIAGRSGWDQGNFNYDGAIGYGDALILQHNFNVVLPAGSAPAATAPAPSAAPTPTTVLVPPSAPPTAPGLNSSGLSGPGPGDAQRTKDRQRHAKRIDLNHAKRR